MKKILSTNGTYVIEEPYDSVKSHERRSFNNQSSNVVKSVPSLNQNNLQRVKIYNQQPYIVNTPSTPHQLGISSSSIDTETTSSLAASHMQESFGQMMTESATNREESLLVVLDCANIGWQYGKQSFSAKGIQIAYNTLLQEARLSSIEIDIVLVLPVTYFKPNLNRENKFVPFQEDQEMESESQEFLWREYCKSKLLLVPSGEPDDAYILNYAKTNIGFVISNDHYRDHLRRIALENPAIEHAMDIWLRDHRIPFSFVNEQFIISPNSTFVFALNNRRLSSQTNRSLAPFQESMKDNYDHLFQSAIQDLDKVSFRLIQLNKPTLVERTLLTKCQLYIENGMFLEAREDLQYILKLNPRSSEAANMLEYIHQSLGGVNTTAIHHDDDLL